MLKIGDIVRRKPGARDWVTEYLPQIGVVIHVSHEGTDDEAVQIEWKRLGGIHEYTNTYYSRLLQFADTVNTLGKFPKKTNEEV